MASTSSNKLSFSDLSYKTSEPTLISYFSSFGPLTELVLDRDDQDQSLRRGYLVYKDAKHVEQAMSKRPHCLDGRQIHLQRAIPTLHRVNQQNPSEQLGLNLTVHEIFISRLCAGETRELFMDYFRLFGTILDCRVFQSHSYNPQRTGYAFVRFADYDCVGKESNGRNDGSRVRSRSHHSLATARDQLALLSRSKMHSQRIQLHRFVDQTDQSKSTDLAAFLLRTHQHENAGNHLSNLTQRSVSVHFPRLADRIRVRPLQLSETRVVLQWLHLGRPACTHCLRRSTGGEENAHERFRIDHSQLAAVE